MNQSSIRRPCCAISLALCAALRFLAPFSSADAAELTPDEILHRSKEAMKPPIRYRKISEGATTLVCQKVLSDGSAAIRIEVISPVRKVSLILGKSICEFYLDHGVGIDTSFLMQSVASQGAAMSANLGGNARGTSTVRTLVSEDGREFLEITTFYPPNIFTAIADGLPATMKKRSETIIPLETRTLIDRKTFQTVETRTVSQAGSTISLTEYRDIERPADLGDDLFLPPDGLELLKPQGTHEYVNMLRAIHSMPPPQAEARERAAVVRPKPLPMLPQRMGRPEIDPRTGRIIPTFPPLIPAFSPRVTRDGPALPPTQPTEAHAEPTGLTVDDILRRSIDAMKPPIRYRVICNGVTSVVSQKMPFGGITATRVESSSPVAKVCLALGKESWELYPNSGAAVETTFIQDSFASQAAAAVWAPGEVTGARVQDATVDGRECFEVIASYPSSFSAIISRALSNRTKKTRQPIVPHEARAIIDKQTFEIIEMRLMSEAGEPISRLEVRDIERPPDLADDLFIRPNSAEVLTPQQLLDYRRILRETLKFSAGDLAASADGNPEIEIRTGRVIPPLVLGTRRDEFERRIGSLMAYALRSKPKQMHGGTDAPGGDSHYVTANIAPSPAELGNDTMPAREDVAPADVRGSGKDQLMVALSGLVAVIAVGVFFARRYGRTPASHQPKPPGAISRKKRPLLHQERRSSRRT